MLSAVKPKSFQDKIRNRAKTGRPPSGHDKDMQPWRLKALKNSDAMYELIRENARYMDTKKATDSAAYDQRMHVTNQVCRNYQHGNCSLGEKCTRKHINADGTVAPTAGPANTSHSSDTNSRPDCWHWTNGKTCPRGDTCHFKHDPEKFGTTSRNRVKSKGDTSSGGGGHNTPSSNGGGSAQTTTNNTGATTSAKCVVCTGTHVFFDACPLKEKVGRILRTAGINYSHTSRWWQNAKNLQAVADWRSKNPKQFLQQARDL